MGIYHSNLLLSTLTIICFLSLCSSTPIEHLSVFQILYTHCTSLNNSLITENMLKVKGLKLGYDYAIKAHINITLGTKQVMQVLSNI